MCQRERSLDATKTQLKTINKVKAYINFGFNQFHTMTFRLSQFLCPNCAISSLLLSTHYSDDTNSQLQLVEWNDDILIPQMMEWKQTNPDLKVTLAVGGWNHENTVTSKALHM